MVPRLAAYQACYLLEKGCTQLHAVFELQPSPLSLLPVNQSTVQYPELCSLAPTEGDLFTMLSHSRYPYRTGNETSAVRAVCSAVRAVIGNRPYHRHTAQANDKRPSAMQQASSSSVSPRRQPVALYPIGIDSLCVALPESASAFCLQRSQ